MWVERTPDSTLKDEADIAGRVLFDRMVNNLFMLRYAKLFKIQNSKQISATQTPACLLPSFKKHHTQENTQEVAELCKSLTLRPLKSVWLCLLKECVQHW